MINLFGNYRGYEIRYKGKIVGIVSNARVIGLTNDWCDLQYTLIVDMKNGNQTQVRIDELERPCLVRRVLDIFFGSKGLNYVPRENKWSAY